MSGVNSTSRKQAAETTSCSPCASLKSKLEGRTKLVVFAVLALIAFLVGAGIILGTGGFSWLSFAAIALMLVGTLGLVTSVYYYRKGKAVKTSHSESE